MTDPALPIPEPWATSVPPSASDDVTRHSRCSLALSRHIFAIATFDSNGLLERSEVRRDRQTSDWTGAIFSAISFKDLLDAALNHKTFRYAKVSSDRHVAFLVRRRRRYVALLSEPLSSWEEEAEIRTCLRELGTGDLLAMMRADLQA